MHNTTRLIGVGWGLVAGGIGATSIACFTGTVYREGILEVPLLALFLTTSLEFLLYNDFPKRITFAFFTAVVFSLLSLVVLGKEGRLAGPHRFWPERRSSRNPHWH